MNKSPPTTGTVVLYVEDEPNDALFMGIAFRKAGLLNSLQSVTDGGDAMDYLAGVGRFADRVRHPLPALMLLDLNLPIVSGFEVLTWLKGRPELKDLPVVVFSSSSRDEDRSRAKGLGAADYIEKPQSGVGFYKVVQDLKERWLVNVANG